LFASADLLFVPSLAFVEQSNVLRNMAKRVEELPNGVWTLRPTNELVRKSARVSLGIRGDQKTILFLGSLNPNKGLNVLLEATARLREIRTDFHVLLVGDGLIRKRLEMQAAAMKIQHVLTFVGYVGEKIKELYLSAADIFVLPSPKEVFPMALLEALASGLPCIVTNLTTCRGITADGKNALVVPVGDPDQLFIAMSSLLDNVEARKTLSENALSTASRFRWPVIAERAVERYRECILHKSAELA